MSELLKKYKPILLYIIFGILTTIVNIVSYTICYKFFKFSNVSSNIIAWILAVIFAFIVNKIYVFESKLISIRILIYELITFFGCRIITGMLDLLLMFIAVDIYETNAVIMKIISNILVTILNYIASRTVIFRKEK